MKIIGSDATGVKIRGPIGSDLLRPNTNPPGVELGWTIHDPSSAHKIWNGSALSYDGRYMICCCGTPGRTYITSDYGVTWSDAQPAGDVDSNWLSCCVSRNGQYMGASNGTRCYVSSDYGATWATANPSGDVDANWWKITCSGDGKYWLAYIYNNRLYKSSDYGVTWAETQPLDDANHIYGGASISKDGGLMAVAISNGYIYTSTNQGSSWTEEKPAGETTQSWFTLAVNDTDIIAATNTLRVWLKKDGTWSDAQPIGNYDNRWRMVGIDDTGSILIAGGYKGTAANPQFTLPVLRLSIDGGATWRDVNQTDEGGYIWRSGAVSGNGMMIIASIDIEHVYTWFNDLAEKCKLVKRA